MSESLDIHVRAIDEASGTLQSVASQMSGMTQGAGLERFGQGIAQVGGQVSAFGQSVEQSISAPVRQAGMNMFRSAADFEASMNSLRATTGATGENFDQLRQQAINLGSATQFSATRAAQAQQYLGMAGFNANQIMTAMPDTLALAAAGTLNLARSADIASNVLTGFGMQQSEMGRVADVFAQAARSANTNVEQLGTAFGYVGPIAKSAGYSFEETTAILGKLSDAGYQGSKAGTVLRGGMARLLKPTGETTAALERLGVGVLDASGNLRPMGAILDDLSSAGASTADILTIFGQVAGPGMAALMAQGGDAIETLKGKLEDSQGVAQEMADIQMEGAAGAIAELQSAWEGLSIAVMDTGILSGVTGIVKGITSLVQKASGASPMLLKIGVAIAAVAAAAGPLIMFIGGVVSAIGTITSAIGAMGGIAGVASAIAGGFGGIAALIGGISLGPVLGIAAAVAAIGFAAYKFAPAIGAFFKGIAQGFKNAFKGFGAIGQAMTPILQALESVRAAIGNFFSSLGGQSQAGVQAMSSFGSAIGAVLGGIVNIVVGATAGIINAFVAIGTGIGTALGFVLFRIPAFFAALPAQIMSHLALLKAQIVSVFQGITTTVGSTFAGMGARFQAAFAGVMVFFQNLGMQIGTIFQGIVLRVQMAGQMMGAAFQGAIAGIRAAIAGIGSAIAGMVGRIQGAIAGIAGAFQGVVSAIAGAVGQIRAALGQLPGVIQSAVASMVAALQGAIGSFRAAGAALMRALAEGIKSAVGAAVSAVQGAVSQVRSLLPGSDAKWGPLSDLTASGAALIPTFASAIDGSAIQSAVGSALSSVGQLLGGGNIPALAPPAAAPSLPVSSVTAASNASNGGGNITINLTINASGNGGIVEQIRDASDEVVDALIEAIERRERLNYSRS